MNYKHCSKCSGEMVVLPTEYGSTTDELTCSVCGYTISIYDMPEPYRVSLRAASNCINDIESTKQHYARLLAEALTELEQRRDIELANLFNPDLPSELEALRESLRQQLERIS